MGNERHTFVVTLEEDVAEFLDVKHKSASELNMFINQVLLHEKERQYHQTAVGADWTI